MEDESNSCSRLLYMDTLRALPNDFTTHAEIANFGVRRGRSQRAHRYGQLSITDVTAAAPHPIALFRWMPHDDSLDKAKPLLVSLLRIRMHPA